jgi:hypothetical protein
MGAQSAVLGYEFGLAYEMGKRTVKAMPNDLFNKLVSGSADEINVVYDGQEYNMKYSDYIDFLVKKFHSSKIDEFREHLPSYIELQNTLIEKTVEIELAKANRTPSAFREIFEAFTAGFTEQQKNDFGNFLQGLSDGFSKFLSFFGVNSSSTQEPEPQPETIDPNIEYNITFNYVYTDTCDGTQKENTHTNYTGTKQWHKDKIAEIKATNPPPCQSDKYLKLIQAYTDGYVLAYNELP